MSAPFLNQAARAATLTLLVALALSSVAQTLPAQQNSVSTQGPILPKCTCEDALRLQDRLQKLEGIRSLVANKVKSAPTGAPATQQGWVALQAQIGSYLKAIQFQNLTTFPDADLFIGNKDPFCEIPAVSAGACLDQDFALHQQFHDATCRSGSWAWQTPWTDSAMMQEELTALQAEIDAIQETLKHLGCGAEKRIVGINPSPVCAQFMVIVQVVTTTAINQGGLTERSARSLNNGQGIPVPLVLHDDGTFEGFGQGVDTGAAAGATRGERVTSQFGHIQAVAVSGSIQQGSCTTKPCQPDVMHLTLVGGPSQQITTGQARGELNRNMQQTTATGSARLQFDLHAYVGGTAHRSLLANSLINSNIFVGLLQSDNGAPALPDGSSLLFAQKQCSNKTSRKETSPSEPTPRF
jgi:hypothetical protein